MDGLYIFDKTCSVSFEVLAHVEKLVNGDDMLSKDEVAVKVGRESITRGDMTRLQGPFKPASTPDQKLWLSDTNMNGLLMFNCVAKRLTDSSISNGVVAPNPVMPGRRAAAVA